MKIGIVGAGAMGTGIGQVAAQAGCSVIISDLQESALDKSSTSIVSMSSKCFYKSSFNIPGSAAT